MMSVQTSPHLHKHPPIPRIPDRCARAVTQHPFLSLTRFVVSNIATGIQHPSRLSWLVVSAPITPKAEMSNEGAGVVTAEDHGRGGSHHGEERRVLGALLGRHSCTFLGAIQLQGRVSYFSVSPLHTVSFGQVETLRRGCEDVAASGCTGVEEENGETEKVT